jgi:DNA-binding XRE family transcriptional regulator
MLSSSELSASDLYSGTRFSDKFAGFQRLAKLVDQQKFFFLLGQRIRALRRRHGHSQEDMMSFNFSARHWQQIEAGRPITVSTLLRICAVFKTPIDRLVRGLDRGIYED